MAYRSLSTALVLRSFAAALAATSMFVVLASACSSSGDSAQSADAGADDGAADAADAADASDGSGDPAFHADPTDTDEDAGYEPSLDIVGSWIYFDNGQPWVRVAFAGSWPPPTTLAYWSCAVYLGTADGPLVTYTKQDFAGNENDSVMGLDPAKVTFAAEPKGFRVLFADATIAFDHYGISSSMKAMTDAGLAQDTSGAFAVTTKVQRPFGP